MRALARDAFKVALLSTTMIAPTFAGWLSAYAAVWQVKLLVMLVGAALGVGAAVLFAEIEGRGVHRS